MNSEIAPPCEKPPIHYQRHVWKSQSREIGGFTKHYSLGRDALVHLGFDETVEIITGFEDARLIMGLGEIAEVGLSVWSQSGFMGVLPFG